MTQIATLGLPMSVQVIEAADWDREPARGILVTLLMERHVLAPLVREVEEAERAGLVACRPATLEALRGMTPCWSRLPVICEATETGRALALKLAHSAELCQIAQRAQHCGSSAVDPARIFAELRLRDEGACADAWVWASSRTPEEISRLPRRGLDAEAPSTNN